MAGLNPFAYRAGRTALHTLDIRCKMLLTCLLSLALVRTGPAGCLAVLLLFAAFLFRLRIHIFHLLWQLKWFWVLLGFVFLARGLGTPGTPVLSWHAVALTREGMAQGGLVVFRFFLMMVLGIVFSVTTKPSELKGAVQWFLAPVPFVPEKKAALMVSLSLRFLPLVFRQADEVSDAFHARCGHLRKNPVQRITLLCLPFFYKTFAAADRLALAMDARCYCEQRTGPAFNFKKTDGAVLLAGCGFCLGLMILG